MVIIPINTHQETTLETGQCPVESSLLDGHLSLTVELLAFRSVNERYQIGSHPSGQQLIKVCVCVGSYRLVSVTVDTTVPVYISHIQ